MRTTENIVASISRTDKNIILFTEDMETDALRFMANSIKDKTTAISVLLSGDDTDGYRYVIVSNNEEVSEITKNANTALLGRGGGRDNMSTGTFKATREEIEEYFIVQNAECRVQN